MMMGQTKLEVEQQLIQADFYGIEDGLSNRYVTSIHQDDKGFMWFSTAYGLNRFDGYHFKWFTEEKNGLQSNQIDIMLVDATGKMWLIHTGSHVYKRVKSIDLFDPGTENVNSFDKTFGKKAPFDVNEIFIFARNNQGHLVFLTPHHLFTYTDHFETLAIDGFDALKIKQLCWADDGRFWLTAHELGGEPAKLYILEKDGSLQEKFEYSPESALYIYNLDQTGEGKVYEVREKKPIQASILKYQSIHANGSVQPDTVLGNLLSRYGFMADITIPILQKHKGYYWVQTIDAELVLLPENGGQVPRVLSQDYPTLKNATYIYSDRAGAVWVGSQFGVHRIKLEVPRFRKFLYHKKVSPTDRPFSIRGMAVTQQAGQRFLWAMVEQNGQLWKVDLNTGVASAYITMGDNRWAVEKKGNNQLFFAGTEGIHLIEGETGELKNIYPFTSYEEPSGITFIHKDKYGKIWFDHSYRGDLSYFSNGDKQKFANWIGITDNFYTYQFVENETDTAWLGTSQGLFRLNIRTGEVVERFWKKGIGKYQLPYDHIYHFHQADDGTFWLGTFGGGLLQWHPESGILRRFTRANGLPNNDIYAVYPDEFGNFWLPTDNGISVLNPTTGRVRTYTTLDGLTHNEFNRIAHCQDDEGNIYFGTLDGITAFHPGDFGADSSSYLAPMVIIGFQQFDNKAGKLIDKTAELWSSNTITVLPNDPLFNLQFSLMAMEDMQNVLYAFWLEGVDEDWTYQEENSIHFGRLPYGNHILHIKAQAANGQWSNHTLQIQIKALRPFYLQVWFPLSIVALLSVGFFFYYRQREKSLKERSEELESIIRERTSTIAKQKEELESLDEQKSRFFDNISHELRTPLSLMLGPIQRLLKEKSLTAQQTQLLEMARHSGQNLRRLVNEILDLGKMEAGKMELSLEVTRIVPFSRQHFAQFESLAERNEIDYQYDIPPAIDLTAKIDREKCRQIIFNLLSNAFKFTPSGGSILVRLKFSDNQLQMEVKDSGEGIHPEDLPHVFDRYFQTSRPGATAAGGTGIGLAICQEYARMFGGKISVESTLHQGTNFCVKFPVEVVESAALPATLTEPGLPSKGNWEGVEKVLSPVLNVQSATNHKAGHPSILVVEDNPDLQKYLRTVLEDDYHVLTARNGQEALTILQDDDSGLPDLILSDLMMPVMDGYQLLEKLKSDEATRQIPVIMLSARSAKDDRLKALRIGVDDYLTKPFEEEELLVRMENLLKNHSVRKVAEAEKGEHPDLALPDREWLEEFEAHVQVHLSSDVLNVQMLASDFAMSKSTLLRQLKRLTGLSPRNYLLDMRLDKARHLLETKAYTSIAEVALKVGYVETRSFSRSFKKRFGKLPSDFTDT